MKKEFKRNNIRVIIQEIDDKAMETSDKTKLMLEQLLRKIP